MDTVTPFKSLNSSSNGRGIPLKLICPIGWLPPVMKSSANGGGSEYIEVNVPMIVVVTSFHVWSDAF